MCLAVPGKIISIKKNTAKVRFGSIERSANVALLPKVRKGDYSLVHAGFAITHLEPADAKERLAIIEEAFGPAKT